MNFINQEFQLLIQENSALQTIDLFGVYVKYGFLFQKTLIGVSNSFLFYIL